MTDKKKLQKDINEPQDSSFYVIFSEMERVNSNDPRTAAELAEILEVVDLSQAVQDCSGEEPLGFTTST